jgi:hypothetical protein
MLAYESIPLVFPVGRSVDSEHTRTEPGCTGEETGFVPLDCASHVHPAAEPLRERVSSFGDDASTLHVPGKSGLAGDYQGRGRSSACWDE